MGIGWRMVDVTTRSHPPSKIRYLINAEGKRRENACLLHAFCVLV